MGAPRDREPGVGAAALPSQGEAHAETVASQPAADAHAETLASAPGVDSQQPTLPAPGAGVPQAPLPRGDRARYAFGGEVARGGMGRIVRAEDRSLGRSVAIKELTLAGGDARGRFVREALVTARLQHPAIVPVYDAGTWPGGEPFYAMKLVAGRSLADVIEGAATREARLALLPSIIAVAEAIAYAHARHIIHRDLKPANILMGDYGETVVIDWGLAKDIHAAESDAAAPRAPGPAPDATVVGTVMGTPAYMPPEQARGLPIDERADVYALGAILYHVLTGAPPYRGKTVDDVLDAVLAGPPPPLERAAEGIAPDLAAIVGRAMARDKDARYPSARELAAELKSFQNGQLVSSYRYSLGERLRRFVRRHRGALIVAAALTAILAVTAVISVMRIMRERDRADRALVVSEQNRATAEIYRREAEERASALTLEQARASLGRDATAALAWLLKIPASRPGWGEARVIASAARAAGVARARWRAPGAVEHLELMPDGKTVLMQGGEWLWLRNLETGAQAEFHLGRSPREDGGIDPVAVLPGGKAIVFVRGPEVRVLKLVAWNQAQLFEIEHIGSAQITAIVPSSDRHFWVIDDEGKRATVDLQQGGHLASRGSLGGRVARVAFAPHGSTGVAAGKDGVLLLGGAAPRRISAPRASFADVAVPDDGRFIAATQVTPTSALQVWDGFTGAPLITHQLSGKVKDLALSPDGARVAVATSSEVVELAVPVGALLQWRSMAADRVRYSARGQLIALTRDGLVLVADSDGLSLGHPGVLDLAALPDGRMVSAGSQADLRVWDIDDQRMPARRDDEDEPPNLSRDGRWLQSGDPMVIAPVDTGSLRRALPELRKPAPRISTTTINGRKIIRLDSPMHGFPGWVPWATSADGSTVALLGDDGLEVGPRAGPRKVRFAIDTLMEGTPRQIALSADGSRVALGWKNRLHLIDVATGADRELAAGLAKETLSPDGRLVAGRERSEDGSVALGVYRADSGAQVIRDVFPHKPDAKPIEIDLEVALSPDGKRAAAVAQDGRVHVWRLEPPVRERVIELGVDGTPALVFARDSRTLAVAGGDGKVRLFEVGADKPPRLLRGPTSRLTALAMADDGSQLAAGDARGGVWLWDVVSAAGIEVWRHQSEVTRVVFAPGGLLSLAEQGGMRFLGRPLPADPAQLRGWLERATTVRIDDDDQAWTP